MIFDILMVVYIALSVLGGYKKGFLVSVSGIAALVLSFVIYKIFALDYIYFALLYIVLSVVIVLLAKIIKKLKLPIIAKTDAILGTVIGALNGLLGVVVISLMMFTLSRVGDGMSFLDSSFIMKLMENILPY